jgi:cbb3-type cytochrome oxidase subunit 3
MGIRAVGLAIYATVLAFLVLLFFAGLYWWYSISKKARDAEVAASAAAAAAEDGKDGETTTDTIPTVNPINDDASASSGSTATYTDSGKGEKKDSERRTPSVASVTSEKTGQFPL